MRDRVAIWVGVGICVLFDVAFIPTILAACVPSASKGLEDQEKLCYSIQAPVSFVGSGVGVFMNCYIIALPVKTIISLHMERRKKSEPSPLSYATLQHLHTNEYTQSW